MNTISGDDAHAGWRKFDIDCQDALPVSIAFTDNDGTLVSGERNFSVPGGKLLRYHVPDLDGRNAPKNLKAIDLDGVDRAVVSKDGKWIVIVTETTVRVRNLVTNEVVEVVEHASGVPVHAVDISPDSTTFATGSEDKIVRIFSINTGKLLLELSSHDNRVIGVKFSPDGKCLATASFGVYIVWDPRNNYTVLQRRSGVIYSRNDNVETTTCLPLCWSSHSDRLFTISSRRVMVLQLSSPPSASLPYYGHQDSSVGAALWFKEFVPAGNGSARYSLATNGGIVVYAAGNSLSFWDTFTRSKIGPIITFEDSILALALSSDSTYLACGRGDKKITVYLLRDILPLHVIIDPTFHLPFGVNMSHAVFQPLVTQQMPTVYEALGKGYYLSHYNSNCALVGAYSQNWSSAVDNASLSLAQQSSIIDHITLARGRVGQGKPEVAFEAFESVFRAGSANDNRFFLLVKATLLFLSGKRENAVTRVKDLVSDADNSEKYNCLQVLGNMYLIQGDWKEAFESFARAHELSFYRRGYHLMTILLIFGPSFEEREITLRYPLRQAVVG